MNQSNAANQRLIRRLTVVVLIALSGGGAGAQDWLQPKPVTDWKRHFRLGAVVGLNMEAKFKLDGEFNVSGGGQSGVYDDGYVRVDDTGNAGGYTSFWGYRNASQYNATDRTLAFHSASSFNLADRTSVDSTAQVGVDVLYGGNLTKSGDALIGWEFGFTWIPFYLKDSRELETDFNRTAYVFDTGDIVVPESPYTGGSSGLGPTIIGVPLSVEPEMTSVSGTITGSRALSVTLYNFRLGPSMHWELSRYFAFSVSGGAALGIADCEYKFNEKIQITDGGQTSNKGSFGETKVLYGAYGGVTFMYHTPEKADIFIGAHFMMLDKVGVSSAGRQASLDLGGNLYLSAGVNWPF